MHDTAAPSLLHAMLRGRKSLDDVLSKAGTAIAEAGDRNRSTRLTTVSRNGVSVTRLYQYSPSSSVAKAPQADD